MPIDTTTLITQLNWRYATKKFDPTKRIPNADWETLLESLRLSPSSYGLQPWRFVIVETPELRKTLRTLSWNQEQVETASHFIVITTLKRLSTDYVDRHIARTAALRQIPIESLAGYRQVIINDLVTGPRKDQIHPWSQRQAYIAMGTLMTSAALMHIDTCPLEGIQASAYDQTLGLETTDYATVAAVALGYRHPDDKYQHTAKVRFTRNDIIDKR